MFSLKSLPKFTFHTAAEKAAVAEATHLRSRVSRLEDVLAEVIAASDEVLGDMREREAELRMLATNRSSGFAEVWNLNTAAAPASVEFFAGLQPDQRAQRWLLDTSSRPAWLTRSSAAS